MNYSVQRLMSDRRLRFLAAGTVAAGVNWVARFPLNAAMPFSAAVVCATAVGMVVGFLIYRAFVFIGSQRRWPLQARDFVLVNSLGAAITALVAIGLNDFVFAGFAQELRAIAHAIGIAAGAVANYFGHKTITFRMT